MTLLIDGHEDLAYNMLTFDRDYRRSTYETRRREVGTPHPINNNGDALIGWPELQRGQVGMILSSLFVFERKFDPIGFENQAYDTLDEAYRLTSAQLDLYERLCDESPDQFKMICNRGELENHLRQWLVEPVNFPERTHPVGLVLTIEGAEGISGRAELEEWWQRGVRIITPAWAGTRYCGATKKQGKFTPEGLELLESMAELGYTLDIAHMSDESVPQALDIYDGTIIASHANARALLKADPSQRQLPDNELRRFFERDGVIGAMPFNRFLLHGWLNTDPRELVTLSMFIDQIDHICQIAGDARHVAIGTDYDGGFGWPAVPLEIDTIADLQKISALLSERGYSQADIDAIYYGNWQRKLQEGLPE